MPSDAHTGGIAVRLELWRRIDPDAPAMRAEGGRMLTRSDLALAMRTGRDALRRRGIRADETVAVLLREGFDAAVTTLQVAGACTVAPLRPGLGVSGWTPLFAALAPKALVVSAEWPEAAVAAAELGIRVVSPAELNELPAASAATVPEAGCPELILATSGSTGVPKMVRIPQYRLVAGSSRMAELMGVTPQDRALLALPLHHALGMVSGLLLPLLNGACVVVADGFDPGPFLRAVYEHRITWFSVAPAMHRALLDQHAQTPLPADHCLRLVRSGTVSLPQVMLDELSAAFGVPVIEAYGMTECPHISCNPPGDPRPGSVGRPVVEELAVVDDAGQPVPPGAWGQVVLRGAPLMTGYLNPAEGGAEFRDGWLQTGDEGRLDDDGYLYLRGRIGDRINRGGAIVIPAVVDSVLMTHPDVRHAVTFAIPHPSLGQDLAAAVVVRDDSAIDEAVLRSFLAARLEQRQVPSRIAIVEAVPVGTAGKVVRSSLADALLDHLRVDFEPPRDAVEDLVTGLFTDALASRLEPGRKVGRLTNFFVEGGDSLAAMTVMAGLAHAGWGERPPTVLFDNPTPAGVAVALREGEPSAGGNIVTLQPEGSKAPLFIVHGLAGHLFDYVGLAEAFAPQRPVYGLQAAGETAESLAHTSVAELAARYAEQIMTLKPEGLIHLVGYSLGGWYAHAVAGALIDRGARVGMLAILDSHPLGRVPLRARLPLLVGVAAEHLRRWMSPPDSRGVAAHFFGSVVRGRVRRIRLNMMHGRSPDRAVQKAVSAGDDRLFDPFKRLVKAGYQPAVVPVVADLVAPATSLRMLKHVWSCYTSGVQCHPLFDEHSDFVRKKHMPDLTGEITQILLDAERRLGYSGDVRVPAPLTPR